MVTGINEEEPHEETNPTDLGTVHRSPDRGGQHDGQLEYVDLSDRERLPSSFELPGGADEDGPQPGGEEVGGTLYTGSGYARGHYYQYGFTIHRTHHNTLGKYVYVTVAYADDPADGVPYRFAYAHTGRQRATINNASARIHELAVREFDRRTAVRGAGPVHG